MAISAKKFVVTDPMDSKEIEVHYMVTPAEETDYLMLEKDDMGGLDQLSVPAALRLGDTLERMARWVDGPGRRTIARFRKKERDLAEGRAP